MSLKKLQFFIFCFTLYIWNVQLSHATNDPWYIEHNFEPQTRIKITLTNILDFDRVECPVIIPHKQMPIKKLHEMWVTIVDPTLPPDPEPTKELLRKQGGHLHRKESNGHQIFRQLDDLDKDGIWDEIFFMTDIKAHEQKTMYIYIGFSERGWNEHGTHAAIGSYCRHLIPFWESRHVGWKLWYPNCVDVYGKRKSMLMSTNLYMLNLNGYGLPYDQGSDIMTVSNTFGGGALCLFEEPSFPDSVSRPRYTPVKIAQSSSNNFNSDPLSDTRYAYDVVVNGPLRSMIRVKTMNWHTGAGFYEFEQFYTAYRNQNYSTCKVKYSKFFPEKNGVMFGCGIRKNGREFDFYQQDGIVITIGDEDIEDPDDDTGLNVFHVDYVGTVLIVKNKYEPEYQFLTAQQGNHTFRIPLTDDLSYEYLIAAAWSEGEIFKKPEEFKEYIIKTATEYNNPVKVRIDGVEKKRMTSY